MYGESNDGSGDRVAVTSDTELEDGQVEEFLLPFQSQMIDHIIKSNSNEIMFLPTGLGQGTVVNAVIKRMLLTEPKKHVILCAARPGQVLSFAVRLQSYFDAIFSDSTNIFEDRVSVGAYCGGDFLYDFPKEFEQNRILVFTAGLLMRLTKLGVYSLNQCSLMVLHDAFYAIRNHPMNTLVREYYWKIEEDRPKLLGTMLPQTHALKRPFDKLRQSVRRLSHSTQSGICLPAGHALESLASRIHHSHIAIHGYDISREEDLLIRLIQKHFLHVWDVLHEHKQNHFGRLIHFPSLSGKEGSPEAECNQADVDNNVVDPFHHDWEQILIMVRHSITFSKNLPDAGADHCKNNVAIVILEHVDTCVEAVLECMAGGTDPAVKLLFQSFVDFREALESSSHLYESDAATEGNAEVLLLRDVRKAVVSSPLIEHLEVSCLEDLSISSFEKAFVTHPSSSRIDMLRSLIEELGYSKMANEVKDRGHVAGCVIVSHEGSAQSLPKFLQDVVSPENVVLWNGDRSAFSTGNVVIVTESCAMRDRMLRVIRNNATDVIWFSPNSVMHAAGFDYDSNALNVLRQICGVGDVSAGSPGASRGPKCHILATKEQSLAWIEISKADQVLLAAAEFVSSGDASLEESLSQLAMTGKSMFSNHGVSSAVSVAIPSPSTILHIICLGLCGYPPSFNLYPVGKESCGRDDSWQATVVLPLKLVDELAASQPSPSHRGSSMEPFVGQLAGSSSEARDAAAEAALSYLTLSSTVSAYWQTRNLLDLVSKVPNTGKNVNIEAPATNEMARHVPASPFSTMVDPEANPLDSENLICSICGIVTTSLTHLKEHEKGRRHQKNLARLQEQQKSTMPQAKDERAGDIYETSPRLESTNDMEARDIISKSNTIDKLPSSLSDAMVRRNSSQRQNSNVYEGFPCVRVGEYALPSSMDLRAFLEEMESKEELRSDPSPRSNFLTDKSPREEKKTPRQYTPRNNSRQSTPRQKSSRQSTPRDHGNPRMEPLGPYAYHITHDAIPSYGMLFNDPYHEQNMVGNGAMYQYSPFPYLPFLPQPAMVHAQIMQQAPFTPATHMMPAYIPGVMMPNGDTADEFEHAPRPPVSKRKSPRSAQKKN